MTDERTRVRGENTEDNEVNGTRNSLMFVILKLKAIDKNVLQVESIFKTMKKLLELRDALSPPTIYSTIRIFLSETNSTEGTTRKSNKCGNRLLTFFVVIKNK
ncbi:hypothetical protein V1477_018342 [Vespula maculifrons]|uniref:Uncharacterized protein n=3 Tax=Vespula TaxID=7451 RepID=A0A834NVX0_VESGE|nr:hypothetical protein HZH66_001469 [Vespula vulgaris]KAF7418978.1 hypothetical protein HZH68_001631 [Vespula germanica]